jgi:hypothetical protein
VVHSPPLDCQEEKHAGSRLVRDGLYQGMASAVPQTAANISGLQPLRMPLS